MRREEAARPHTPHARTPARDVHAGIWSLLNHTYSGEQNA
jgi:hypothetical protein